MQKTKSKILTILLIAAVTLAVFPFAVNASTGYISILTTPAEVPAGGNISLSFTNVLWSGGQFYLMLSTDGFSQVSPSDLRYTPSFNVVDLIATSTITVTDSTGTFPGSWVVGNNQIVGSIPRNVAGGTYRIKAFDGAVTSLAVTDQAFTMTASIAVNPTSGGPGRSLAITGNAFPANALVNVTYFDAVAAKYVTLNNLTQTDAIGNFSYTTAAPDIIYLFGPGDLPVLSNGVDFQVTENKTRAQYNATYTERQRGLKQIGRPTVGTVAGNLQNATGLYGNMTSFTTTISVGVGDSLRIAGQNFYPGPMSIKWDNSVDVTPANLTVGTTGSSAGNFNTTITVPTTGLGPHNITIDDAGTNVVFVVFLNVVQSITISPSSGPIGTPVTVKGFGFPATGIPAGNAYNVTVTISPAEGPISTVIRASTLTDTNGQFTTTFNIPNAPGGLNTITATANNSLLTSASAAFTVTTSFTVTPSQFYANSSNTAVVAKGTGADPASRFFVAIDNQFSPFSNTTNGIAPYSDGVLNFTFVGVGFQPGLHLVSLYLVGGDNTPVANATFIVLSDPATDVLSSIKADTSAIKNDTSVIRANVTTMMPQIVSISNGIATIQTSLGTITSTLNSIQATLNSVSGDVATIDTTLGSVQSSLSSVNMIVTATAEGVATIQTDVGTIKGTVTATDGKVATIQTDIGTLTTDVANLQTSVDAIPNKVNIPIYIAAAFAIVAAIAAIMSLIMMRRKIAG